MSGLLLLLLGGCQEYKLVEPPKVPPATPPGVPDEGFGGPPDWADCLEGWHGRYTNLSIDHPDVEPPLDAPPPGDPDTLDWWEEIAYTEFNPALDFGNNWYPVDDGMEGDPDYFAVSWVAWLRATDDTTLEFLFGANTDAWIHLDGELLAELSGVRSYQQQHLFASIDSGQYPIQVRFAHRTGASGFRFRVLSGDITLCYPDFGTE